jgi:Xaa-Pro dipeptidase
MSGPKNTEEAWGAFNVSTDRRLQNGDLVLIELDSQADGYWSDISRTFVAGGHPDARQQEIGSIVRDSQQRTIEALRPGMRASEVDRIARAAITERGYGKNFLHHVGHGVGFAFHEMPYLDPPSRLDAAHDYEIQPGMVLAIEPAIYIESWGGIRLEDNIVVTAQGRAEYLSQFDREL